MITLSRSVAIAVACIGIVVLFAGAYLSRNDKKRAQAMAFAGFFITVSLGVSLFSHEGWASAYAAELSSRSSGFLMGALVVFFANAVPKQTGSAKRQATLRVAGWSMVLGGLGYSAAWLFLPFAYADMVAMLLLLAALIYAVARIAWICKDRGSIAPPPAG